MSTFPGSTDVASHGRTVANSAPRLPDLVRLSMISGVGPRLRQLLLQQFGTPAEILRASPSDLRRVTGIGAELSRRIAAATGEIDAEAEIAFAREREIEIVAECAAEYPALLREIPDPPGVVYRRGTPCSIAATNGQERWPIAIVGTRHATRYGLRQAERLAGELARRGCTIVSGLARGIDAAAHRGALAAGGRSVAVLAGGLADIYPPEHRTLAEQVAAHGWLVSEIPPRMRPTAGMFPQRNRIISGMSLGTVVVEAAQRSGALITARHAVEQGREVFAVPGPIDSRMATGSHRLIQDGAKLVHTVADILDEFSALVEPGEFLADGGNEARQPDFQPPLDATEAAVFAAIGTTPILIDQVVQECGLPIPRVLAAISDLEVRHFVTRVSGNLVARRS